MVALLQSRLCWNASRHFVEHSSYVRISTSSGHCLLILVMSNSPCPKRPHGQTHLLSFMTGHTVLSLLPFWRKSSSMSGSVFAGCLSSASSFSFCSHLPLSPDSFSRMVLLRSAASSKNDLTVLFSAS